MVAQQRLVDADGQSINADLVSWQDIEDDFYQGGILIGNGFSQAVWRKFGYSSIYKTACSNEHTAQPLTLEDRRLFDVMGTKNFEMVLSRLSEASEVNKAFQKEFGYLLERYEHIKTALGEAIRAVHVPWNSMTSEVFSEIRETLSQYRYIYSTNYDLLPYWSIMSEGNGVGFKDFFWNKDELSIERQNPYFDISNTNVFEDATRIYYLHGALHIYRDPKTGRTHKLKNRINSNLLDISEVPLFITEGSSADKLKAIRNSDYLLFSYDQFLNHSAPLVVFGHSLSNSDSHLLDAIRKSACKKIAISLRSSNSSEEIVKRKADLYHALCKGLSRRQKPELIFFDAQTHSLGSSAIRIEEYDPFDWLVA